jgi:hypothetical protein
MLFVMVRHGHRVNRQGPCVQVTAQRVAHAARPIGWLRILQRGLRLQDRGDECDLGA